MSLAAAIASSSAAKRLDGRNRAEDLLAQQARVRRARRRARSARRSSRRRRWRAPPSATRAPRATRVVDELRDLAALRLVDQRAELARRARVPRPTFIAPIRSTQALGERPGDALGDVEAVGATCTPRRRCASWRSARPRRRASRSASSKTRKRRVAAQLHRHAEDLVRPPARMSSRPASVEPVNDSLRVRGSSISGAIVRPARSRGGDVQHAGRAGPTSLEDLGQHEHRERRLLGAA